MEMVHRTFERDVKFISLSSLVLYVSDVPELKTLKVKVVYSPTSVAQTMMMTSAKLAHLFRTDFLLNIPK